MRLTVSIVLCAALVAAHPQGLDTGHAHGIVAKRHSELSRSLIPLENSIEAHRIRFPGDHKLEDVPDDLAYPGDSGDDLNDDLYGAYDDEWFPAANLTRRTPQDEEVEDPAPEDGEEGQEEGSTDLGDRASKSKRGYTWTNEVEKGLAKLKCQEAVGIYNWGPQKNPLFDKYKCKFIPHLHSDKKVPAWKKYVKRYYGKDWMMAPNEVNLSGQAKMSPSHCAWLIRTYMLPLLKKTPGDGGYQLIGPSCANGKSALAWYDQFRKSAPDVWAKMHAVNIHFYGIDYEAAIAWIELWIKRYGKPVWITEFACHSFTRRGPCPKWKAREFVQKIIEYCDRTQKCEAYFLYGSFVQSRVGVSSSNALFTDSSGNLTPLGSYYVST